MNQAFLYILDYRDEGQFHSIRTRKDNTNCLDPNTGRILKELFTIKMHFGDFVWAIIGWERLALWKELHTSKVTVSVYGKAYRLFGR